MVKSWSVERSILDDEKADPFQSDYGLLINESDLPFSKDLKWPKDLPEAPSMLHVS